MKIRASQLPLYFFALASILLGILLLSETWQVKPESGAFLEPGGFHRAGPSRPFAIETQLWQKDPHLARSISLGMESFYQTKKFAPEYVGNDLNCTQCHYNGGRTSGMLGLIGVATTYPRWDFRQQRQVDLSQRIQSCFVRSENGKAPPQDAPVLRQLGDYLKVLSTGVGPASSAARDNFIKIPGSELLPIAALSPERGGKIYAQRCAVCHMTDGAGDGWAPPVWGPNSYNDGAGLARVYTLASFLREAMPISDPQSLSATDAQHLAAYLDAQERPSYAGKEQDFPDGNIPVDAVYYLRRYPENPLRRMLEGKNN
jgi:Cytochrome c